MPTLRDLLYLDRQRVRQLLAQVDGGVLESIVERSSEGAARRQGANLLRTVDLGRELTRESTAETTISLEDALLDLLETSLEELDWLTEVGGLDDPEKWDSGWVHGHLSPGALVRLSGPTQLLDPAFIRSAIDRAMGAIELMAVFSEGGFSAANRPKNERARLARAAATKLMGGLSPDAARQLGDLFLAFFGEDMVVRHFPCGPEHRRLALVGTLAEQPGYLADARSALFAKYGSSPSEWTLLAQIATVPADTDDDRSDDDADDDDDTDRAKFEGIAINILRGLEQTGLTGAPAYPPTRRSA